MTARPRPADHLSQPLSHPWAARRVLACGWANRPSLGAWALLLGVPGAVQAGLGWSWWWAAAVQWPLYTVLWLTLTVLDIRQQAAGHLAASRLHGPGKETRR
ncbi:hypothetical protein ACSNOI_43215 [Actinomadura kijaniata]|uniref:hypothetical protein n=1 Tax=Actinomadura kijaniata TaxID=46161 RepID=UPI003F1AFD30